MRILVLLLYFDLVLCNIRRRAKKHEFPFVVGLVGEYICGGTLISYSKFLTAGTCLVNDDGSTINVDEFHAVSGALKMPPDDNPARSGQIRKISEVQLHIGFKKLEYNHHENNIGVVILAEPFDQCLLDTRVVKLPRNMKEMKKNYEEFLQKGEECVALGWTTPILPYPVDQTEDLLVTTVVPLGQCPSNKSKHEICVTADIEEHVGEPCGDAGTILICNGTVHGHAVDNFRCGKVTADSNVFLLYWPYFDYFDMGDASSIFYSKFIIFFSQIALFGPLLFDKLKKY